MSYHADPRGIPTRDEERELARRIRAGEAARAGLLEGEWTHDEGRAFVRLILDGVAAWKELTERNMPLVFMQVRGRPERYRDDLCQDGLTGLMTAARAFDPDSNSGGRFSTYATPSILNAIQRGTRKLLTVHVPNHLYYPTEDTPAAHIAAADVARQGAASIHELLEDYGDGNLPDHRHRDPLDAMETGDEVGRMFAALDRLPERTALVIRLRAGLDGPPLTMGEIGERIGVTKERVRQIEKDGLRKLAKLMGSKREPCSIGFHSRLKVEDTSGHVA